MTTAIFCACSVEHEDAGQERAFAATTSMDELNEPSSLTMEVLPNEDLPDNKVKRCSRRTSAAEAQISLGIDFVNDCTTETIVEA